MPKPGHARIALALCALIITIAGFIPPAHASEGDNARMDAIKAHLGNVIIPDARLEFEKAGPRLDYEEQPGGQALVYAAYYYAITTGDFAVSYADLVDCGYWPYDIYDAQRRDEYLYEFAEEPALYPYRLFQEGVLGYSEIQFSEDLMAHTASAKWIFHARAKTLEQFYFDYFELTPEEVPASVAKLKPCEAFWDLDTLVTSDGTPVGRVDESRVSIYMRHYRLYQVVNQQGILEPANPLDSIMVKCLKDDHWQPLDTPTTTVSVDSGYDSQYRENTRSSQSYPAPAQEPEESPTEPTEPKIGVVPPAQPAPVGARRPGAVAG